VVGKKSMAKSKMGGQWRKSPSTILWMLSLGQLVSWGLVYYTFPLFVVPMAEELGWSRSSMFGALSAGLLIAEHHSADADRIMIDRTIAGLGRPN